MCIKNMGVKILEMTTMVSLNFFPAQLSFQRPKYSTDYKLTQDLR